ncbi:Hce2 domain-containing protein [Trichophyton interdigitale]|uniref:Hce2 domain-containing protein n=1 Tax=Trichophyton interdigitale TaxID=101480 RepID=A0A9P5CXG0_9EURO|nr:Hce2 domain-containing protein [Trichophyton interdigitale]KAF3900045.1 Hce2 domain-containing protein [Trichophyton interdigitale]KAG8211134.1 Hce2 domain-containing protein [Trichophyton interdigitale]
MKLNAAVIFASLIACASAAPAGMTAPAATTAPAPQTPNEKPNDPDLVFALSPANDCGDSTFTNGSSPASPLVADCLKIASNIAGGGTWTVQVGGWHQLVQFGTCALGVRNAGPGWHAIKVGNQDIVDVINTSVQKFKWFDKVGASGEMPCQIVTTGWGNTQWSIYHN